MTTLSFSSTPARAARLIVVALVLMLAVAALAATTAHAAGIVVNDAGDTTGACATTGTGTCTLRDAITYANSNAGADTITFNIPSGGACASANTCTITLGSTLPFIAGDVTIDGAPNNGHITVSGASSYRILVVDGGNLTVNALTLANGSSSLGGGAIQVGSGRTLNVTNSTFSGNQATNATAGGAIDNVGTANVTNSTFYNNSATGSGNGGAIFSRRTLNVTNSTFSGNNAGGLGDGIVTSGVNGTTTLKNTLLANSANGANCYVAGGGTLTADAYNIADDNTCASATQKTSAEIALGALADNGGPTQTMALGAGSAAINAGNNAQAVDPNASPLQYDQRGPGFARIIGGTVDVGAFEAGCAAFPRSVATEDGLNDAIRCYNAETVAGTYTINITQDIDLTASTTAINNATGGASLTIEGDEFEVDGQGIAGVRPFLIEANTTVTMNRLTVTGGNASGNAEGGGIHNYGTLNLIDATIRGNTAGLDGGGLSNRGSMTIDRSTISGNSATSFGGGIINHSGNTLTIHNSTLSGNSAVGGGGAQVFGTTTIDSVTFSGNTGSNGALQVVNGSTTVRNSILANSSGGLDCYYLGGTLTDGGHNLIGTQSVCGFTNGVNGNIVGQPANLGPLANNGGPTWTHALLGGSPAIDAGDTTLTVDQRGVTRPQAGADDIGAFELEYTPTQTGPNFVVNHSADTDDGSCDLPGQGIGNQDCTLREAINAANGATGANTITFDIPATDSGCTAANTCTITLGDRLPIIQFDPLTIDGAPNNGRIKVDGVGSYTVFDAETDFNLNALTVANGWGFLKGGGLHISSGSIDVLVSNSTFVNNSAQGGGHIKNLSSGTVTIVNSTFFDTPTTGIGNNEGTMLFYNSTLNGNNLSGSTGVEALGGTVTLYNTIVVNHEFQDCYAPPSGGTLTADSFNIDEDGTCDNATSKTLAEVNLQALADNGGPTWTMAIDDASAAFNTGDNAVCAAAPVNNLDQRGAVRPYGASCDVGAYEYNPAAQTGPNFVVNSAADTDDGSCDLLGDGVGNQDCTLREAINAANANSGADTITFDIPATDSGCTAANTCTITLGDRLPIMRFDPLKIDGAPNNGRITVDGAGSYTVFDAETDFNLNALTVQNGFGLLKGAGLHISSGSIDVLVSNSTFVNNSAQGGGHIKNLSSGTVTIVNSTFFDTPTTGIGNNEGTMLFYNSTLNGNNLSGSTGVEALGGTVTLYNTIVVNHEFQDCYAPPSGGTLTADSFNIDEDGTCDNATSKTLAEIDLQALADNGGPTWTMAIDDNSAAFNTGDNAVCAAAPVNNLDQRGVTRPQGASCDVGAYELACPAFPVSVANEGELNFAIGCYNAETAPGTYTINITQDIDLTASTTAIDNAISGVELLVEGGGHTVDAQGVLDAWAFFIKADAKVTIREITVTGGNTTGPNNTGAVISVVKGTLTLIDSTLTGNQGSFGGALSNATGTVTIENSTLSNNNASGGFLPLGGAIFNAGSDVGGTTTVGTVNVINSTISGNQTSGRGGGIYNSPDGVLNVTNSTISDNQATVGGGGIVNSTDSTITLNNTIVANSTGGDCVLDAGTINAENSLIEDGLACVNGTNSNNLTGDPNLGVLQNNGGPTETHALLPGSIAINAGANALAVDQGGNPLTTDQRGAGFPRIIDGAVDMGAYEASCPAFPVSVANEGELNFAIACFNAQTAPGVYTINVTGDIDLSASATTIDNPSSGESLVIEGNNHQVDGQGIPGVRPFRIAANTTVTMNDLGVAGGNVTGTEDGGGIRNAGNLTINNGIILRNEAGDMGGGVFNSGVLVINRSTITDNEAQQGGGIRNSGGDVTVSESLVEGNDANAGANASGLGGGIDNGGVLRVSNSTVSGNQAAFGGGGVRGAGQSSQAFFDSVTIAANTSRRGSGIRAVNGGQMTIVNTIVGDNVGSADCDVSGGTITDGGYNLVENPGTCTVSARGANGRIVGVDPKLGPLANNGGPTQTHALLPGSPAIDAGDTALTTDQRGYGRPAGTSDDIGAYEANATPLAVTLAGFDAQAQAGHVLVTWETVSELENAGFNLYRTATADRPTPANLLAYVPSQGPGSTQGFAYSYQDQAVTAGQTYWYWLEDVDFNGAATLHGPVSVVFTAPTAVTLNGLEAAANRPAVVVWPWLLALVAATLAIGLAAWRRHNTAG